MLYRVKKDQATSLIETVKLKYQLDRLYYHEILALILVGLASFVFTIWVWYPGVIYWDTSWQLLQAEGKMPLSNWHPPIMSLFWRAELWLFSNNPGVLVITWIGLSTFALGYFLSLFRRPWYQLSLLYLVLFFSPFIFGVSGSTSKDNPLTWLVLILATMLAKYYLSGFKSVWRTLLFIYLTVIAALLRYDAIFSIAPLFVAWFLPTKWRFGVKTISLCLVVSLVGLMLLPSFNRLVNAHDEHAETFLMTFDKAGISHFKSHELESLKFDQQKERWGQLSLEEKFSACYQRDKWDIFAWGQPNCIAVKDEWRSKGDSLVHKDWLKSIFKYPFAYLHHRFAYYSYFMGFSSSGWTNATDAWSHVVPGNVVAAHPDFRDNIFNRYSRYTMEHWFNRTPLSYGISWIVLAFLMFVTTIRNRTSKEKLVNCLFASSLLRLFAFFIVGIAPEWRYLLPNVIVEIVGVLIYFLYFPPKEEVTSHNLIS